MSGSHTSLRTANRVLVVEARYKPVTGLVSSVRLASGKSEAVAIVDGKEVQVGRITALSTPTPSSGTSSSAAS